MISGLTNFDLLSHGDFWRLVENLPLSLKLLSPTLLPKDLQNFGIIVLVDPDKSVVLMAFLRCTPIFEDESVLQAISAEDIIQPVRSYIFVFLCFFPERYGQVAVVGYHLSLLWMTSFSFAPFRAWSGPAQFPPLVTWLSSIEHIGRILVQSLFANRHAAAHFMQALAYIYRATLVRTRAAIKYLFPSVSLAEPHIATQREREQQLPRKPL